MNGHEMNVVEQTHSCPMCDKNTVSTQIELEKYEYGVGEKAVLLNVYIPINKCMACGYEFVGEKADELRYDAICDHLRLLRPGRIQELRMRLGGSQKSFAGLTHLGQASIQRWEQRQVLQSESNDLYMRLLEFPENVERLERWNNGGTMEEKKAARPFNGKGLNADAVCALVPASQSFTLKKRAG